MSEQTKSAAQMLAEQYEQVLRENESLKERIASLEKEVAFHKMHAQTLSIERDKEFWRIWADASDIALNESNAALTAQLAEREQKLQVAVEALTNAEAAILWLRNHREPEGGQPARALKLIEEALANIRNQSPTQVGNCPRCNKPWKWEAGWWCPECATYPKNQSPTEKREE